MVPISNGVNYTVRNKNKKMRDQLKFLKQYEADIINKLRTECINLNGYKKYEFDETSGKCIYCDVEETVNRLGINVLVPIWIFSASERSIWIF